MGMKLVREVHRLMVFGKRCLGRIFACKRGKETGE
jgi:hypothetical protein